MGRLFTLMLMLSLALTACEQPQPISTTPRAVESPFARRTVIATATAGDVAIRTSTAHNPFSSPTVAQAQSPQSPDVPTQEAARTPATPVATLQPTTAVATLAPSPTMTATPGVIVIPKSATPISNEQRWRMQQINREVLNPHRSYVIQGQAALLWYDPLTSQTVEIGLVSGSIPVQALFVFRPDQAAAIEVPYRINSDFGLTSVSDAVIERMRRAGYTETVESFIILTDAIRVRD